MKEGITPNEIRRRSGHARNEGGGSVRKKTYDELYEHLDEAIGDLIYTGAHPREIKWRVEEAIDEAIARKDQAMIDRYLDEE